MKRFISEFLRRGFVGASIGPIVLAIVYLILQQSADVSTLTVDEVCAGIFSLSVLAFVAAGMNAIYQIERLPIMIAFLIHGGVLYIGYLVAYLLNDWLDFGVLPVIVFTAFFVVGYILIWAIIYLIIRRNTAKLNEMLRKKQQNL
jgi:branched-subunit amino acid ABC-type transport system permease component